jgi:hypothetical protein
VKVGGRDGCINKPQLNKAELVMSLTYSKSSGLRKLEGEITLAGWMSTKLSKGRKVEKGH